jgi:1-deoxy-D-xylulose-5-phosphate reductoisomerase
MDMNEHAERFPGLGLAWKVLEAGAGHPAILNAANEVAVESFLNRQIRFDQIHSVNLATLSGLDVAVPMTVDELLEVDKMARDFARLQIQGMKR